MVLKSVDPHCEGLVPGRLGGCWTRMRLGRGVEGSRRGVEGGSVYWRFRVNEPHSTWLQLAEPMARATLWCHVSGEFLFGFFLVWIAHVHITRWRWNMEKLERGQFSHSLITFERVKPTAGCSILRILSSSHRCQYSNAKSSECRPFLIECDSSSKSSKLIRIISWPTLIHSRAPIDHPIYDTAIPSLRNRFHVRKTNILFRETTRGYCRWDVLIHICYSCAQSSFISFTRSSSLFLTWNQRGVFLFLPNSNVSSASFVFLLLPLFSPLFFSFSLFLFFSFSFAPSSSSSSSSFSSFFCWKRIKMQFSAKLPRGSKLISPFT